MGTLLHDVRFAWRSLRRDALVNLIAAVSLSLALAGNTTVFSLINAFIFRPLPYPAPERIVLVGEQQIGAPQTLTASPANLLDWRERNRSFSQLAAFQPGAATIGLGERPMAVASARVSPEFFDIVGVRAVQGRTFLASEGVPGNDNVALVTELFVDNRMGDFDEVVGAQVMLNGTPHTIVGVLPGDFEFFFPNLQVWMPLALDRTNASRDARTAIGIGRMNDGLTMEQVRDDMGRIWDELVVEYPDSNRGYRMDVNNFRYEVPNAQGRTLFGLMQGAVFFVLLIACVNIANLLRARGERRRREIALRTILGASRRRIIRQLLVESVLLASAGGVIGLGLAFAAVRVIGAQFAAVIAGNYIPTVDLNTLVFSLAMTLFAGIAFGVSPSIQAFKVDMASAVKEGSRSVAGAQRNLLGRGLVVAEIALSMILLSGTSIMVRTFLELRNADPGFDSANLLTMSLTLPVDDPTERLLMLEQALDRATGTVGVSEATAASTLPQNQFALSETFMVEGRPIAADDSRPRALWVAADPTYVDVLGLPMLRGRFLTREDGPDGRTVVVINQALAERHFPDQDPLGQLLVFREQAREIVGVIGNTRQSLVSTSQQGADAVLYIPLAQAGRAPLFILARTGGQADTVSTNLRTELQSIHSQLVVGPIQTLDEIVEQLFVGINVFNVVLTAFGNLALLLAAIGTYGVLAFNVAQRGPEIGVRIAMGAESGQVVRMIVRQGATLGAIGMLLGAPGVFVIVRVLRFAIQGLAEIQLGSVFVVAAILMSATLLASLLPALRAARMDPADVLRQD